MTRTSVRRLPSDCASLTIFSALFMCLLTFETRAWSQESEGVIYFASDEIRLEKLLGLKEILDYRVAVGGETRSRDTFFDADDLFLYRKGMSYCIKEGFHGPARLEFTTAVAGRALALAAPAYAVPLPPEKVLAARNGQVDGQSFLSKKLQALAGPEAKKVQLVVEYERHGVILERGGRPEFFVNLLLGSFEGFSGRKLKKQFYAVQIATAGKRGAPSVAREIQRIAESLIPALKLNSTSKSLYAQGIEKAVRLRSDERLIQVARAVGGTRGKEFEQFDMPDAVAFTLDGNLVTGDTDNARFKIYHLDEKIQTVRISGGEGSAPGQFDHRVAATIGGYKIYNQVQGITVDRNGFIYVIDQGNSRVQAFDADGKVAPEKTIKLRFCDKEHVRCADGLWRPSKKSEYNSIQGLATDGEGAIFVSDKGMSRIYRFLPDGNIDLNFDLQELDSASGRPILQEPESLAVYQDKLFVANEGAGNIKTFDRRTGKLIGTAAGFGRDVFGGDVEGLAVVRNYLFVVDVQNSRIAVFDVRREQPKFLLGFVGDFESADGIAIDPTGKYVAIADQGHLRVVLFSLPEILYQLERFSPNG